MNMLKIKNSLSSFNYCRFRIDGVDCCIGFTLNKVTGKCESKGNNYSNNYIKS